LLLIAGISDTLEIGAAGIPISNTITFSLTCTYFIHTCIATIITARGDKKANGKNQSENTTGVFHVWG